MTKVFVQPLGGLCNRLRVVDAAIALGERSGRSVHVVWQANAACNAQFLNLFESSNRFQVIDTRPPGDLDNRFSMADYEAIEDAEERELSRNLAMESDIDYRIYWRDLVHYRKNNMKFRFDELDADKSVYIVTDTRFMRIDEYGQHFTPTKELRDIISTYTSGFNEHTIGVHIRRGDHHKAIAASPLPVFIDAMQKRLDLNSDTNFFLATDDASTEEELRQRFPSIIATHTKSSGRDDNQGMKDGVVDLYSLAGTTGVIGTPRSSYSFYAAKLGGLALIRAGNTV